MHRDSDRILEFMGDPGAKLPKSTATCFDLSMDFFGPLLLARLVADHSSGSTFQVAVLPAARGEAEGPGRDSAA